MARSAKLSVFVILAMGLLTVLSCRNKPFIPDRQVSFSNDVFPIIGGNCTASDCHGAGGRAGELITYDDLMKDGNIVAGNPHASSIYRTITAQNGSQMPVPPQSPLTDQQIQTIFIWIEQGAKNN